MLGLQTLITRCVFLLRGILGTPVEDTQKPMPSGDSPETPPTVPPSTLRDRSGEPEIQLFRDRAEAVSSLQGRWVYTASSGPKEPVFELPHYYDGITIQQAMNAYYPDWQQHFVQGFRTNGQLLNRLQDFIRTKAGSYQQWTDSEIAETPLVSWTKLTLTRSEFEEIFGPQPTYDYALWPEDLE